MSTEIIQSWSNWEDCIHEWKEIDSQFSNELFTDVVCVKCQCPGQLDNQTKRVFFPAT